MSKDVCFLRKGMIAELETVNEYRKMMMECETDDARKLFESIIQEEIVHVGEFQYLIERMCPMTQQKTEEGKAEASELLSKSMIGEF